MKRIFFLSALSLLSITAVYAQQTDDVSATGQTVHAMPEKKFKKIVRPSTYHQADSVRKALDLDQKQFSKVFSAYDKYNNSVFGKPANTYGGSQSEMREGRRGKGGPGMGPGGGGMGPGGRGPRGGGDRFQNGESRPPRPPRELPDIDTEKVEKEKVKQEEKLIKEMQKILKDHPGKYKTWEDIRKYQVSEMFPEQ